jgi:hypothetical protein
VHAGSTQPTRPGKGRELTALVGVHNLGRSEEVDGLAQRLNAKVGLKRIRDAPCQHLAGVPVHDCTQPNHDIHAGCSEGAAASASAFPKAAVQQAVAALADAAISSRGSEAQIVTFAKSVFRPGNTAYDRCDAA